jgi:hypothetical protein
VEARTVRVGAGFAVLVLVGCATHEARLPDPGRSATPAPPPPAAPSAAAFLSLPPDERHAVVPGKGLCGIELGKSTGEDVLRVFGADTQYVGRTTGQVPEKILGILYPTPGRYSTERPGFAFDIQGRLTRIDASVYPYELRLPGGVGINSTRGEVLAALGTDYVLDDYGFKTLTYPRLGLTVNLKDSGLGIVLGFTATLPWKRERPHPAPVGETPAQGPPLLLVPGAGVAGLVIGKSKLEDAVGVFGGDGYVQGSANDIAFLSYDEDKDGWHLETPRNRRRPQALFFGQDGVLWKIRIGPQQTEFKTQGGLGIGATKDDLTRVLGADFSCDPFDPSVLDYAERGISCVVSPKTQRVEAIDITAAVRPAWKGAPPEVPATPPVAVAPQPSLPASPEAPAPPPASPEAPAPPPASPEAPALPPAPPAPPAKVTPAAGATFVLIVGVNDYDDPKIPRLHFAEADAREVFGFFATEPRSPAEADRVQLVAGKNATRANVLGAIREHLQAKAVRPEDMVVLYFAGHGFSDANGTYLACRDTSLAQLPETSISLETLASAWTRIRAGRKVLIADACHSGGLEGLRGIGGVALAPESGPSRASSLTIAATGANELSTEDERLGHGVFTLALLRGLRGEADTDKDGRVSGDELGEFLRREVPAVAARANGNQTPVVRSSRGDLPIWLTRP